MDIPSYSSSGALTREHYTLVRNVELAASESDADQYIFAEVQTIRRRIGQSSVSSKQCRECLILLLYCANALSPDAPTGLDLAFAFPHAVNLAEAGRTLGERRIGYLFCAELIPRDHDLQLMLVNTIRKDIESHDLPRLCLALDALIQSPSAAVIPAVQPRLHSLLSHSSPHVRRRTLLAHRALAHYEPDVLNAVADKARRRLRDASPSVVGAALVTCDTLLSAGAPAREKYVKALNELAQAYWRAHRLDRLEGRQLLPVFRAFFTTGTQPDTENTRIMLELLRESSTPHALLLACYFALSTLPLPALTPLTGKKSPINALRPLLRTDEPNDRWLFLACIERLAPTLWAGTDPALPAALDGWEVGQVMGMLDGRDVGVRRKTLRLLHAVDPALLTSYSTQLLHPAPGSPPASPAAIQPAPAEVDADRDERARRLLELAAARSSGDGRAYALEVQAALTALEGAGGTTSPTLMPGSPRLGVRARVIEGAVEGVLVEVRDGTNEFRRACTRVFLDRLRDITSGSAAGPSATVVCAALACESASWVGEDALDPGEALRAFADVLDVHSAPIQDACLLAMLRLVAWSSDVMPAAVTEAVEKLAGRSGRYVRRRCDQFLTFSKRKEMLKGIVAGAKSSSLPDFLAALEAHETASPRTAVPSLPTSPRAEPRPLPVSPRSVVPTRSQAPGATSPRAQPSKLRYAAYDAPPAVTRSLRPSPRSPTAAAAAMAASRVLGSASPRSPRSPRSPKGRLLSEEGIAMLERTITPGELAPGAGELMELRTFGSDARDARPTLPDLSRDDLITLDSPFSGDLISEPAPPSPFRAPSLASSAASMVASDAGARADLDTADFGTAWAALPSFTARGWSERAVSAAVRRMRSLGYRVVVVASDRPPFEGSTKVLVTREARDDASVDSVVEGMAALKLLESEDESCLWQMRCDDDALREELKGLLSDD